MLLNIRAIRNKSDHTYTRGVKGTSGTQTLNRILSLEGTQII